MRIRAPFHLIDEEVVVLSVDHTLVAGKSCSLKMHDAALAKRSDDGFETLWAKGDE
ncbi:MAG TPA: hypothetical protein VMJ75_18185 [Candidatus Acidoferrales bacterium]|nr:hypothetical protein [Candidatus Acidoferrales bacterium]